MTKEMQSEAPRSDEEAMPEEILVSDKGDMYGGYASTEPDEQSTEYIRKDLCVVKPNDTSDKNICDPKTTCKVTKEEAREALNTWAEFHRVDHLDGDISYESHGYENYENANNDAFICIKGVNAKCISETIRKLLEQAADLNDTL